MIDKSWFSTTKSNVMTESIDDKVKVESEKIGEDFVFFMHCDTTEIKRHYSTVDRTIDLFAISIFSSKTPIDKSRMLIRIKKGGPLWNEFSKYASAKMLSKVLFFKDEDGAEWTLNTMIKQNFKIKGNSNDYKSEMNLAVNDVFSSNSLILRRYIQRSSFMIYFSDKFADSALQEITVDGAKISIVHIRNMINKENCYFEQF